MGLKQECILGGPPATASFDTPTASIANSYNWILQVDNSQIAVWNRNGQLAWRNNLGGPGLAGGGCVQNADSFFGGTQAGLNARRIVDTKVLYDSANQKFCVIGMQQDSALAAGAQGLFVAWSNTDNPMPNGPTPCGGGWRIWRTPVPVIPGATSTYQPDFNGMGQTSTHIVWSGVLQPVSSPNAQSYTMQRYFAKSALSQDPQPNPLPYFDVIKARPTAEFSHVADVFDASTPMYMVGSMATGGSGASLRLEVINQGVTNPFAPGNTVEFLLPVAPYVAATGAAPQVGGTFLDTIDGRMQGAVVRNGSLYCCHTVIVGSGLQGRHAIRWYQIALNGWPGFGSVPSIVQSGDIDLGFNGTGQPVHAFMPAMAVNAVGTVMIVYARSAANETPAIQWSGRRSFDAAGTMPQGGNGSGLLRQSNAPYTTSNGTSSGAHRWGDWSSAVCNVASANGSFLVCGDFAMSGGTTCQPLQANHWETWIAPVSPNSNGQTVLYGTGFPVAQAPSIALLSQARLGWSPEVVVGNPTGLATLGMGVIGMSRVPDPGLATPYGATLWVDPALTTQVFFGMSSTEGRFNLVIPTSPAFIGQPVFVQGVVFDAGAAQGVEATAGMQVNIGA